MIRGRVLRACGAMLAVACGVLAQRQEATALRAESKQTGERAAPTSGQGKPLSLEDFKPISMLHASVHEVARAKSYAIDIHNHVNDARAIWPHVAPERVVAAMDQTNVRTAVILTGGWGSALQRVVDEMVKPYPGRFLVFTQIDWSRIDDPGFPQQMVAQIDDAVARGARGLKVLKDFGLVVRSRDGKLLAIDDARLDPIWAECGKLGIPVAIHTADPEAFFHPLDERNERYEELVRNPDWSFYGPQFPSIEALLTSLTRVFAKHPQTTFIALHMGWPENLDWVAQVLDRHANVSVEFGAREAELGRQPRRARELFMKYPDRILFGTDNKVSEEMYRNHFRWLETNDEYFEPWAYPGQGRWPIYGLGLPDDVLEKVYHRNAERILRQFKG